VDCILYPVYRLFIALALLLVPPYSGSLLMRLCYTLLLGILEAGVQGAQVSSVSLASIGGAAFTYIGMHITYHYSYLSIRRGRICN
jgi:hypothetical protein